MYKKLLLITLSLLLPIMPAQANNNARTTGQVAAAIGGAAALVGLIGGQIARYKRRQQNLFVGQQLLKKHNYNDLIIAMDWLLGSGLLTGGAGGVLWAVNPVTKSAQVAARRSEAKKTAEVTEQAVTGAASKDSVVAIRGTTTFAKKTDPASPLLAEAQELFQRVKGAGLFNRATNSKDLTDAQIKRLHEDYLKGIGQLNELAAREDLTDAQIQGLIECLEKYCNDFFQKETYPILEKLALNTHIKSNQVDYMITKVCDLAGSEPFNLGHIRDDLLINLVAREDLTDTQIQRLIVSIEQIMKYVKAEYYAYTKDQIEMVIKKLIDNKCLNTQQIANVITQANQLSTVNARNNTTRKIILKWLTTNPNLSAEQIDKMIEYVEELVRDEIHNRMNGGIDLVEVPPGMVMFSNLTTNPNLSAEQIDKIITFTEESLWKDVYERAFEYDMKPERKLSFLLSACWLSLKKIFTNLNQHKNASKNQKTRLEKLVREQEEQKREMAEERQKKAEEYLKKKQK